MLVGYCPIAMEVMAPLHHDGQVSAGQEPCQRDSLMRLPHNMPSWPAAARCMLHMG